MLNHPFMKETPLPDEITRYTLRKCYIYIFNYDISQIFDYQPQIQFIKKNLKTKK